MPLLFCFSLTFMQMLDSVSYYLCIYVNIELFYVAWSFVKCMLQKNSALGLFILGGNPVTRMYVRCPSGKVWLLELTCNENTSTSSSPSAEFIHSFIKNCLLSICYVLGSTDSCEQMPPIPMSFLWERKRNIERKWKLKSVLMFAKEGNSGC